MVVRSFRCLKPLLSASYSGNPLADVWRAILKLDTIRFTAFEQVERKGCPIQLYERLSPEGTQV
jgi:hypothetical protein